MELGSRQFAHQGTATRTTVPEGTIAGNPLGKRGIDAVHVSSHRRPPTDRPCICKGVARGCLSERAGTRQESQLASFTCGISSLSGNATLLQKLQFKVWTPSQDTCILLNIYQPVGSLLLCFPLPGGGLSSPSALHEEFLMAR
jgi:hypothetical protein